MLTEFLLQDLKRLVSSQASDLAFSSFQSLGLEQQMTRSNHGPDYGAMRCAFSTDPCIVPLTEAWALISASFQPT